MTLRAAEFNSFYRSVLHIVNTYKQLVKQILVSLQRQPTPNMKEVVCKCIFVLYLHIERAHDSHANSSKEEKEKRKRKDKLYLK